MNPALHELAILRNPDPERYPYAAILFDDQDRPTVIEYFEKPANGGRALMGEPGAKVTL